MVDLWKKLNLFVNDEMPVLHLESVAFFPLYERLESGNTRDLEISKKVIITTVIKYTKKFKWSKRSRNWRGNEREMFH